MSGPSLTLYLDVDGVVLPYRQDTPPGYERAPYEAGTVIWRPALVQWLNRIAARNDIRIVWLTDWQHQALTLAPAIGLDGAGWDVLEGDTHFNTGPEWWKLTAVQADQESNPSPFAWCDDVLPCEPEARSWIRSTGRGAVLCPHPEVGLDSSQAMRLSQLVNGELSPSDIPGT